ncbi:Putative RNA helicase [Brettanomyces nanus]|uniref:RNA helicase n=1 Tax=Eeniella nana TaxID=13502 RepID=A0A875S1V8_EENNA|nr:Putative RNA helicase [Brettanomyces nanus]QPG73364.1 Putative RNA helicase [Brettanomyces nanus]
MSSFKAIGLPDWLCNALHAMRIIKPTSIQAATIPEILNGRDCIGGAKTGSGKTIAFAAPMLTQWAVDPCGVFGIVLTPTRELAMQIADQFAALGANVNLKVALVIGGESMINQTNKVKENPDFIIATPGRLAHIISENPDDVRGFSRVKYLVLDEADRLLTDSFGEDLAGCLKAIPDPTKRQTLLFTATVTDSVRTLKDKPVAEGKLPVLLHELDKIDDVVIPDKLSLGFILTPFMVKEAMLHNLLTSEDYGDSSSIVFVNRSETAETLRRILRKLEVRVTSLHSQLPQQERTNSLQRFRAGAARVLVTTDLGSRGLDIPTVQLVINYDIPRDPDDFIHRVGRTARAERKGDAISFITPNDLTRILAIEERIGRKMEEYKKITDNQVIKNSLKATSKAKVEARMDMDREGFNDRSRNRKRRLELEAQFEGKAPKRSKKNIN